MQALLSTEYMLPLSGNVVWKTAAGNLAEVENEAFEVLLTDPSDVVGEIRTVEDKQVFWPLKDGVCKVKATADALLGPGEDLQSPEPLDVVVELPRASGSASGFVIPSPVLKPV